MDFSSIFAMVAPKSPGKPDILGVFNYYSGGGSSQYYFEGYNLMGDPSVQMAVWGGTGIGDQSGGEYKYNRPFIWLSGFLERHD